MNVLLVARDIGGCNGLLALGTELADRGHSEISHHAMGKPVPLPTDLIVKQAAEADLVVTGRSSSPQLAVEELAAISAAVNSGVPFGIYTDNFVVLPPWFEEAGEKASFIFTVNGKLAEETRAKYPNALAIASGNPTWEAFCTPKYTREEVRAKLGYEDADIVILSPGTKIAAADIIMWGAIMQAVCSSWRPDASRSYPFQLLIARHPGDHTQQEVYDQLAAYSPIPTRFLDRNVLNTSDALPGVDLVIESGGSAGVEAAHLRLPVITYLSEVWLRVLEKAKGNRIWEPAICGATVAVYGNPSGLAKAMFSLLQPEIAAGQRKAQVEVFPAPPAPGTAAKIMADTCELFGKK